ncbi:MAG: hypothetical protein ABJC79_16460 [Acidimicrobiia bacterium]
MNAATSTQMNVGITERTSSRDARRWIERQLRWERTLGSLRSKESHPARQAA